MTDTRSGLRGICPQCKRWIGVTKRTERLYHHGIYRQGATDA